MKTKLNIAVTLTVLLGCLATLRAEPVVGSPIIQFKYESGAVLTNSGSGGGTGNAETTSPTSSTASPFTPLYGNSGAWPAGDDNTGGISSTSVASGWGANSSSTFNSYTISMWARFVDNDPSTAGGLRTIMNFNATWQSLMFVGAVTGTGARDVFLNLYDSNTNAVFLNQVVATLPYDGWTHLALRVADGGSGNDVLTVFTNGALSYTFTTGAGVNINFDVAAAGLAFGQHVPHGARGWQGNLDDSRFYGSALSNGEIALLAVPEPTAVGLMGVAGLMLLRRMRHNK